MRGMWQKKGVCTPGRGAKAAAWGCTSCPGSHARLGCKRQLRGHPAHPNPSPQ